MLEVDVKRILSVTEARANIATLVDEVMKGNLYVLTRGGRPAVVVAPIERVEKILAKKQDTPATTPAAVTPPAVPKEGEDLPSLDLNKVNQALEEYE